MSQMPSFLRIGHKPSSGYASDEPYRMEDYKPLLGLWLIDLSLTRRWVEKPPSGSLEGTFGDPDFIEITGLPELGKLLMDEDSLDDMFEDLEESDSDLEFEQAHVSPARTRPSHKPRRNSVRALRGKVLTALRRRRKELLARGVSSDLPLFQNVERLGRMMSLNEVEHAVLTFAACMSCFQLFRGALMPNNIQVSDDGASRLLSAMTGQSAEAVRKALRRDSVLLTSGLIRVKHDQEDLESKITLVRDLHGIMLDELASDDELSRRVLRPAKAGSLTLEDFPHLAANAKLLLDYFSGVTKTHERGANILLYGPPGTGKTEFAKALAAVAGLTLYDIGYDDDDGNPIDGEQRLHSLNFCQRALKGKERAALLFDEIEDVLPGRSSGNLFEMMLSGKSETKGGKAWINRSLEDNPVPTLWITNNADIDSAYLRRFDYSVALRIPPRKVRSRIAQEHLGQHAPNAAAVDAIAELDDLLPAQLERAARIARLSDLASPGSAWQHAEMAIEHSRALLGQTRKNLKARSYTQFSLDYLNTDADVSTIITGLRIRPQASFCLYGPPGTGKSLLARHIADELGRPILIKRASDLLNKYIGETEKRIAAMFEQALDEDAVLLLDEADSFLSDRNGAERQWELTQTNELLTQLECFEGMFFATTNLMDKLDAACLRRFSHKVRFDFLKPEQRWTLFAQEFCRQGGSLAEAQTIDDQVRRLDGLTPGDFAVVGRNRNVSLGSLDASEFFKLLRQETLVKKLPAKVGFLT